MPASYDESPGRRTSVLEAVAWISLISAFALMMALVTDEFDMSSKCRTSDLGEDPGGHHCDLIVRKPGLELTIPMPK